MVHLDTGDDLWNACAGDDVTCAYYGTSSKVTNKLLEITMERKEVQSCGWSHCFHLVNTHLVTCNLTLFTCHRMTLNWGQIFNFILRGKKNSFDTSRREEHVCAIRNPASFLAQKLAAKNTHAENAIFFSVTWLGFWAGLGKPWPGAVGDHSPGTGKYRFLSETWGTRCV